MIAGYFIGREHLKHEIRSSIEDTAESLAEGIKNVFGLDEADSTLLDFSEGEDATSGSEADLIALHQGDYYNADDLEIKVEAGLEKARLIGVFGNETRSKERHLVITLNIVNKHDRKILRFSDESLFGDHFVLVDDVGNQIREVNFGFTATLDGALTSTDDVNPGDHATHVVVFKVPPLKTEELLFTVDLKAFGKSDKVQFRIPINDVKGWRANTPLQPTSG